MISLILLSLAAIANAVMDTLQFRYHKSMFSNMRAMFWYPNVSWKNKWKPNTNYKVEKFWGSSRWFVFTTDAFHLFQMIMLTLLSLSIVFYSPMVNWYVDFIIYRVAWGLVFELFFAKVLVK